MSHEIEKIWFVYRDKKVHGPLTKEEVRGQLESGQLTGSDLVWCRGGKSWQKLSQWSSQTISPVELPAEIQFYVQVEGNHSGPFPKSKIVEMVQGKQLPLNTLLWTEGLNQWLTLYESPALVKELGLVRRKHSRVPFVGIVHLHIGEQQIDALGMTLSEGGLAIQAIDSIDVGLALHITIDSPMLGYPIHAKATAVYRKPDEIGLQFSQLSVESRGAIIEYVKNFEAEYGDNPLKKLA